MLLVLFAVALVPSVVLASALGAGPAAILAGLVALFSLIAFMGGPLRPDLRLAAALSPLLLIGAVAPRLLTDVARPAAIALVVAVVFVAALLPLWSSRLTSAGLGVGMATLFCYGYATVDPAGPRQVVIAASAGLVVAVVLRALFGVSDPSRSTREKVADVLDADDPDIETAVSTWSADGRQRWLADALGASSRYRFALEVARLAGHDGGGGSTAQLDALDARAGELAEWVRAKRPPPADTTGAPVDGDARPPAAPGDPLGAAASALDALERAVRHRDTSPVPLDRRRQHLVREAVAHPSARLRSIQVRHAVRTAFAILLMLLITARLGPEDPLVATTLVTTFGILQTSWRDSLAKARPRIVGLVAGSLAVVVVMLVVPPRAMTPIAVAALLLGLWNLTARPAVGYAFMVVVSVGLNASTRGLDPADLLAEYAVLTASAVAVGLLVGFAVIPAFRPPPLRRRIESAAEATEAVLRAARSGDGSTAPEVRALRRDAAQQIRELTPDREPLDGRTEEELDRLRSALGILVAVAATTPVDRSALDRALLALHPDSADGARLEPPPEADPATTGTPAAVLAGVAGQARSARARLLDALPGPAGR
jgi:hypothetical protein